MKDFMIYLSDEKIIMICADTWEKTEDSIIFEKDKKIIALFNSNNIVGFVENMQPEIIKLY